MNAIETALFAYLDANLEAPVYLHEAPLEEFRDFVVFSVAERSETPGTVPLLTVDIETAAVAIVHDDAEGIASELRTLLAGWRWGSPGVRIGPVMPANVDNAFDSTYQKYRVTLTWATQALLY